jgi:signal transduction histidine kinase
LNAVLKGLLADMEDQVNEKGATVLIEPLPSLRVIPFLMRPLFQNLIGNALQYSKKNINPIIKIRSEIGLPKGTVNSSNLPGKKYCSIVIEDNGVGFDQDKAETIFNSIDKLPRNGAYKGAGRGLQLCKNIVEQHHGFISVLGKVNEGATFIISLPMS